MVVDPPAEKTNRLSGMHRLLAEFPQVAVQLQFRKGRRDLEGPVELDGVGDVRKEVVDRLDAYRVKHLALIFRRVVEVGHVGSLASLVTARD